MSDSMLQQKIRGLLVSSAIGSILGRRAENLRYPEIVDRFGVLDDPFPGAGQEPCAGALGTDENELMLVVCDSYLEQGKRITVEDLARTWTGRVNPLDFGDGYQRKKVNYLWYVLRNTFELLAMGCPARLVGAFNVPANTGLCVTGPVSAFNACDPDQAFLDGLSLASLFQRDRGIVVPAILAAAAAEALRQGSTVESVVQVALRLAPSEPHVTARPRQVTGLRETLLEAVHLGAKHADPLALREEAYERLVLADSLAGDPQEMLGLTFAVYVASQGDTRRALIGGANMGRDSDTLAGVLGLLCGAMAGINALPQEWLVGFDHLPGAEALTRAAVALAGLARAAAERRADAAKRVLALASA
jgi:ADP-ribosylglycohydrolase